MVIHLVGLPHTPFDRDLAYSCAYTTKAWNWLMATACLEEKVTAYWGGPAYGPLPGGTEFVSLSSAEQQAADWGTWNAQAQPAITWGMWEPRWLRHTARCIEELDKRLRPGDVVAFWSGISFTHVREWVTSRRVVTVEPAVGYDGIMVENPVAFESLAWQHTVYGMKGIRDGRFLDRVIPGFADPGQFKIMPKAAEPYALWIGRVIARKGPQVAADIAKRAGLDFHAAGTGATYEDGIVKGNGVQFPADAWHGAVAPQVRNQLMAEATVVIVPTLYIEPFGTVHIEAQMAGTPALCSPFGAFAETTARTLGSGIFHRPADAAATILDLVQGADPQAIRQSAIDSFSPEAIATPIERWLFDVRRDWYA